VLSLIVVFAMLIGYGGASGQTGQTQQMGETLRFVFLADSRGGGDTGLGHPIHTEVLVPIIQAIKNLNPPPKFVIFAGDMSYRGYIYTKDYPTGYTFQMWKDLFGDLEKAGIQLYTAIGNHELYRHDDIHPDEGFALENQQEFQKVFSENPDNGPPGYEHLAYSFTSPGGDSFFAVLDPYYLTSDVIPDGLGGNIDPIEFSWLTEQVAQSRATHKFLFIHTPYYYVSNDPEEPSAANQSFTELWSFLDTNEFDFYACGHSHLFSRKTIDSSVPPNPQTTPPTPAWQNNVVQLLNGTCGAGPDTGTIDPDIKASWNVHNDAQTYYFSVVDISGCVVTVNSYSGYTGTYGVFDTFSIDKCQVEVYPPSKPVRSSPTSVPPIRLNPAQMSTQYLSVSPQQTYAGQPVTIITNVVNTGGEGGNYNVTLKINGKAEQTKAVSVGPQTSQPVKFTVSRSQPGTYTVSIDGQQSRFAVLGGTATTSGSSRSGALIAIMLVGALVVATIVALIIARWHPA
jgi:hypothetical protein